MTTTAVPSVTNAPTTTRTALPSPTPCGSHFSDVRAAEWFYPYVIDLACRGAVSGYSDGTFRPNNLTTRAQVVKIVVLAFELPFDTAGAPHFTDVSATNTFFVYIETAYNRGLLTDRAGSAFRPFEAITRAEFVRIVVAAAVLTDPGNWQLENPSTATFQDVPIGTDMYAYVETAYAHGIISGYSCGAMPAEPCPGLYFRPVAETTRAQSSKVVVLAIR